LQKVGDGIEVFIEFTIYMSVLGFLIIIAKFFWYDFSVLFWFYPMFGSESLFLSSVINIIIYCFLSFLILTFWMFFLFIFFWYLYFFFHYWLITRVLLKEQALFLYHPFFHLILKIPPFPQLEKFGVFRYFQGMFDAFYLETYFKRIAKIFVVNFIFTSDNVKFIFNFVSPGLGDKIADYMAKASIAIGIIEDNTTEQEKAELGLDIENPNENQQIISTNDPAANARKKIDEAIQICINNNTKQILPGMSDREKTDLVRINAQVMIDCSANKIGEYLKVDANTQQPQITPETSS